MEEIWKPITGYEGLYEISNLGRVKSLPKNKGYAKSKGCFMNPFISKDGYLLVTLSKNNKANHFQIHRLVAKAFIPNIKNKPQVDHINRVRDDNRVENLRWVFPYENGNNTCCNRIIEYQGKKMTISEWAVFLGIKKTTLFNRINLRKWSVERAFTQPVKKNNFQSKKSKQESEE